MYVEHQSLVVSTLLVSLVMSFANESSTLHVEPELFTMFAEHISFTMSAENQLHIEYVSQCLLTLICHTLS